ncbi:hypothetical protein WAK64_19015 [Bacillus spongiae]|uniref:Phr family secreted Rap phosphatase inhibitor n=1 Tax=Bacillus spongiae TaxID=2683610 RepID=A0ABU8HIB6_9BACI
MLKKLVIVGSLLYIIGGSSITADESNVSLFNSELGTGIHLTDEDLPFKH